MKTKYSDSMPYLTRDGSVIRELMHPLIHGNRALSLAEATIETGASTVSHRHAETEEIYHVTAGSGLMQLGNDSFPIEAGDTVVIMPGTSHHVKNTGSGPLRILCCCAPAYSHDDTELLRVS